MVKESDKPTELTKDDIDRFVEKLMCQEIKAIECLQCGKKFYGGSYGSHIGECDQCWFDRFPKDKVREFYRSFFL